VFGEGGREIIGKTSHFPLLIIENVLVPDLLHASF